MNDETIRKRLVETRQRTLELVSGLDEPTLRKQHIAILSPMIWDLGHIANFEETWILDRLGGHRPLRGSFTRMFDPGLNPRPTRAGLPLPYGDELRRYLGEIRERALRVLDSADYGGDPELARDGFVFELVAEHEEQHQETLLQAMQILDDPPYQPLRRRENPASRDGKPEMVLIPAGTCRIGYEGDGFAYDNERQAHERDVPAFEIDRYPVTAGQFLEFVEGGGYDRRALWSEAGWSWREETGSRAPASWQHRDGRWWTRFMNRLQPLDPRQAVIHVCFHEAEAYCRSVGKRLPTEFEWEKAALWDPSTERSRHYPWGNEAPTSRHANLDQLAFGPARIGAFPKGASAYGVEQMVGDVWEWTTSDFRPYPGFVAYPYPEYSEIFFGTDYKVLRGGSWATRPAVARGTFRNWDFPIRRQIFAGFRCARDVEPRTL